MESEEFTVSVGVPVIYVKESGNDNNDGLSWANPKKTISAAIEASSYGGEIWVMNGSYESVVMRNGRNIIGGFNGTEKSKEKRVLPMENLSGLATTVPEIKNGPEIGTRGTGIESFALSPFEFFNNKVAKPFLER